MERQLQADSALRKELVAIMDQPGGDSDSKLAQLRAIAPNWQAILNSPVPSSTSASVERKNVRRRKSVAQEEVMPESATHAPEPSRETFVKPEKSRSGSAKTKWERPDPLARQIKNASEGMQEELVPGIIITRLCKGMIDSPSLADRIKYSACSWYNKICLDAAIARGWPNFCCLNCPKFKLG